MREDREGAVTRQGLRESSKLLQLRYSITRSVIAAFLINIIINLAINSAIVTIKKQHANQEEQQTAREEHRSSVYNDRVCILSINMINYTSSGSDTPEGHTSSRVRDVVRGL